MAHVIVVGAGAIGSHVLPHIARMNGVSAITIIDHDRYDSSNLVTQSIGVSDVGLSKAVAQARRLKQVNRALVVRAIRRRIEQVPLGWLRGDVLLACLDSRRARQAVNQSAWRLGVPWIDAGIDAGGLLTRVQVFRPSAEAACLECAWDARDYELLEQRYPCPHGVTPAASGAPSALGALAAALQAIECEKLLRGEQAALLNGCDVLLDARHHRHYVTAFKRNPSCRMPDHAGWTITPYSGRPRSTSLSELASLGSTLHGADRGVRLRIAGQQLTGSLTCPACGEQSGAGHVYRGDDGRSRLCLRCRRPLIPTGFDLHDELDLCSLPDPMQVRPLAELGFLRGDVVTLATPCAELRLEMGVER